MCLLINSRENQFYCESDVICYKVVTKELKSPCYSFQYNIGKTYSTEMDCPVFDLIRSNYINAVEKELYSINHGFHTFKSLEEAKKYLRQWYNTKTNKYVFTSVILECSIPSFCDFYEGGMHKPILKDYLLKDSYCSEKLKINKIIYHKTEW